MANVYQTQTPIAEGNCAHIHEFNKEEDKDVRWVDILFASVAKGFVPFVGFLFLLFSIPIFKRCNYLW